MKTTLKHCVCSALEPQGVFIGTRGTTPGPKPARAAAIRPRKRSLGHVSMAILGPRGRRFEPRAVPSVPFQLLLPVSGFGPLVLTESAS